MNGGAVITNEELKVKTGRDYPKCNPRLALLDPTYTYSVPVKQMVSGGFDTLSHWHLDVTFREDANTTLDKQAAQNQNIMRKWSLSILKMVELMKPGLSMKKKRFAISLNPVKYLEEVLSF